MSHRFKVGDEVVIIKRYTWDIFPINTKVKINFISPAFSKRSIIIYRGDKNDSVYSHQLGLVEIYESPLYRVLYE